MSTPTHILVGTDFSEASEVALQLARDYATALGAKLTLAHVYPPMMLAQHPGLVDKGDTGKQAQLDLERRLIGALEGLRDQHLGDVPDAQVKLLTDDHAARGLCEYASSAGADLIVVATHGRTGLAHLLIGSVAEAVLRHATVPVLIARR